MLPLPRPDQGDGVRPDGLGRAIALLALALAAAVLLLLDSQAAP